MHARLPRVSDAGVIAVLTRGASLTRINLGGTPISDASLKALGAHCPRLAEVNLWGCRGVSPKVSGVWGVPQGLVDVFLL